MLCRHGNAVEMVVLIDTMSGGSDCVKQRTQSSKLFVQKLNLESTTFQACGGVKITPDWVWVPTATLGA